MNSNKVVRDELIDKEWYIVNTPVRYMAMQYDKHRNTLNSALYSFNCDKEGINEHPNKLIGWKRIDLSQLFNESSKEEKDVSSNIDKEKMAEFIRLEQLIKRKLLEIEVTNKTNYAEIEGMIMDLNQLLHRAKGQLTL